MKLLLVDNDHYWIEMLTGWLKTMGYQVRRAYTIEQARVEWIEQQPDLVILDPMLKAGDALAMCRDLRIKHDALVLVVTEGKGAGDEVRCLEGGADDYLLKPCLPSQLLAQIIATIAPIITATLLKPCLPSQLLARIHALSRRTRSTLKQRPSSILTTGPLCVDTLHNTVRVYGKTVSLTPTESKILYLLAINANQVCTADQIVTYVWGYHGNGSLIKAHIRHLREKIEPAPSTPRFISTVLGVGYKLVSSPAEELAS